MPTETIPLVTDFRRRRVLVVGLGLHGGGASAVRWFCRQGAEVRATDKKNAAELAPTLRSLKHFKAVYHLGGHRPADFQWAEIIYQNQAVPSSLPELAAARRRGVTIVNETTIFMSACPARLIGVTGSRGKSTTASLLGAVLQAAQPRTYISGNIRQQPMLELLPRLRPSDTVVLELSSFQLEFLPLVKRSPAVAVMTNLLDDHGNRYGAMTEYAKAKFNIFRYQDRHDIAVLNAENPWTRQAARLTPATVWWFQKSGRRGRHGVTVEKGWLVEYHSQRTTKLFRRRRIPLPGDHHLLNVAAATATARALGIPIKVISRVVGNFSGMPHRQEVIRTWRGHRFVNDTTATSPDATLAALAVYPRGLFIVGGTDKNLDFRQLAVDFSRRRTPLVFLPGSATDRLLRLLRRAGYRGRSLAATDMATAVRQAVNLAKPKQAIILSPGAASFGLFKHEFDRGQQFVRSVKRLQ